MASPWHLFPGVRAELLLEFCEREQRTRDHLVLPAGTHICTRCAGYTTAPRSRRSWQRLLRRRSS